MNAQERDKILDELQAKHMIPVFTVHVLQTPAGTLLNRGMDGRAKQSTLGGTIRARVSSQSHNRVIRQHEYSEGETRSRLLPVEIAKIVTEQYGKDMEYAIAARNFIAAGSSKDKGKDKDKEQQKEKSKDIISQAIAYADRDKNDIAKIIIQCFETADDFKNNEKKKMAEAELKKSTMTRPLDPTSALMGRMCTDSRLVSNVTSALRKSHWFSVDEWHGDVDTFSVQEENSKKLKDPEYISFLDGEKSESGSAMLDSTDITSNTFYGHVTVISRILLDNMLQNIEDPNDTDAINKAIDTCIDMVYQYIVDYLTLMPEGKQTSMASNPIPHVAYITIMSCGSEDFSADGEFEDVIIGNEEKSVAAQAVERLARFADNEVNGAFAYEGRGNSYQGRLWISDKYGDLCPEGVKRATLRELKPLIEECFKGGNI